MNEYIKNINFNKTCQEFGKPLNNKSKIYAICQICKINKLTTIFSLKRTLKKGNGYLCNKCRANTPEGKKQRKQQSIQVWNDPKLRQYITNKSKYQANTKAGKLQRSKQAKQAWKNSEYAKFQTKRITELFQSNEHRKLVSERNKLEYQLHPEQYLTGKTYALHTETAKQTHAQAVKKPEYKELHRKLAKQRFQNPEYKEKLIKIMQTPAYKEKLAKARERASLIRSSLETRTEFILQSLNISFISEKQLGHYNFDFYLPDHDLLIECQGEYWHSLDNARKNDASKFTYINKYFPQYRILYLYERDFLNPEVIKQNLIKAIHGEDFEIVKVNFLFSNIQIIKLNIKQKQINSFYSEPENFLNSFHYAQFGRMPKLVYGAYLGDKLIAVCKFAGVIRKEVATSMNYQVNQVLELDRFCIHPEY
ncbi:MAG TPA: hypothetical protein ENO18_05685, partial [Caldithrix sp.]|nr:hypothetical protein [Caldithrix sp.]